MSMTAREVHEGRIARGLTQRELATEVGLSVGSINSYEHGIRSITKEAETKLSLAFKRIKPLSEQGPLPTHLAELSDTNTTLQWQGTHLRPTEVELLQVLAKTMVEQRKKH
ncbi:helix-turn-helix transcriptional regulator [Lacticaseibacillus sp. 866-1]|uniref:helix-turn-helix domain-containing protein n=1 Tax=Lacticaseibacillus sp. 866-1 TaxID=2799576 RepID=UPI00194174FE